MRPSSLVLLLPCIVACVESPRGGGDLKDTPGDTAGADDTAQPSGSTGCRSIPRDADAPRVVLVSLPYTDDLGESPAWALLTLEDGVLLDSGDRIDLGRDRGGGMAFTPDGSIGITALDEGTLGVVAVAEDGSTSVVQSGFDPGAYTSALAIDPSGEVVWLINPNWPENGGGLYRAPIDCETGAVGEAEKVIEAKNPSDIVLSDDGRGLLVGREVPGAGAGADVALLDLESGAVLAGSDAFGDEDAIVSHAALTDSGWLLMGDHSEFSGIPNRIAAVPVDGDTLGTAMVIPDVLDPIVVVPNPVGPGVLVPSGYGDRYWLLAEDSSGSAPWTLAGPVTATDPSPVQLPDHAVVIPRGSLAGRVLAVEVGGIRTLELEPAGGARIGPVLALGTGYSGLPGAIGVQP